MKGYLISALILLGLSLFCGFIGITIGIGSMVTPLNQIARPIVCGNQRMEIIQHKYSYRPGETTTSIEAYCVDDQTGQKVKRTGLVQLVSGIIYGLMIFAVVGLALLLFAFKRRRLGTEAKGASSEPVVLDIATPDSVPSQTIDEKLRKLKQLHEANLITDQDFEKKKSEILDNL